MNTSNNNSIDWSPIMEMIKAQNDELNKKLDGLEKKLSNKIEESQEKTNKQFKDMEESQEKMDKRLKAKESFPSPPYGDSPQQASVITQGSVSNPKWGKRSIFG